MGENESAALRLRFEGVSPSEANRLAGGLEERLRQITRGEIEIGRCREREDTQDLGTALEILVSLLGTSFAVAIANGIRDYIAKSGSRIRIETASGTVVAAGEAATGLDVDAIAAALQDPKAWAAAAPRNG